MKKTKLKKLAAVTGISLVLTMFIIKVIAFYYSNSVSVLASLIDSGADFFTTIITLIAVFTAIRPADKNHRFGHEKAESIGAFLQAIFIFISAVFLVWQAISHIITGYQTNISSITLILMFISLLLTLTLVIFQRYVIKKTNSIAIKADNINYTGDLFTTLGVLISLVITKYANIYYVDAIFGIIIAIYLCNNARILIKESLDILMDKEMPKGLKNKVKKEIRNHKGVLGYHDFRSRYCGETFFIEVHIELDGKLSFRKAHEIAHELKESILDINKNIDIIIHEDLPKVRND